MGKSSTGGRNSLARCGSRGSRRRGYPLVAATPAAPCRLTTTPRWSSALSKIGGTKTTATSASSATSLGAERAGQEIGGQVASRRRARWEGAAGRPRWRRHRRERSVESATATGRASCWEIRGEDAGGRGRWIRLPPQESSPPRDLDGLPTAAGKTCDGSRCTGNEIGKLT
jgi:hypothetical protein